MGQFPNSFILELIYFRVAWLLLLNFNYNYLNINMESETKMQVVNLTVVRHGQSEANIAKTLQKASPLSEAGKEQAQLAGIALKDVSFDQIYSSDQERAFDTALLILKNNDKMVHDDMSHTIHKSTSPKKISTGIQTTPLLRERDFGVYDPKTYSVTYIVNKVIISSIKTGQIVIHMM